MRTVKICIYDEEECFAKRLAAFLNRQGGGKLSVTAVTNSEKLLEMKPLDLLIATDLNLLYEVKNSNEALHIIWLQEKREMSPVLHRETAAFASISRYAGAGKICRMVEKAAAHIAQTIPISVPVSAVYSPVGRCGKTSFALAVAQNTEHRWIYIGMEDYNCLETPLPAAGDSFLYFAKERNKDRLLEIIEECEGIIPSAFSPFDSKMLESGDWEWLIETMRGYTDYSGVLFDIGTGILQEPAWLSLFDLVLVPYLKEEAALRKKENFEALIDVYGLMQLRERIWFIDMGNKEDINDKKRKLGYKWEGEME